MRYYKADLHIHSCLSACADIDITPLRIVRRAKAVGLDIIAIADHNSAENLVTASKVAQQEGLLLIPAMEITSKEEVHILALFETLECAMEMQGIVYRSLPSIAIDEKDAVYQLVVNEMDEILEFNDKALFSATSLSVAEITERVHLCGGLAVASHVDREYFSLISQLGFIPDDVQIDALEISYVTSLQRAKGLLQDYRHMPWIRNSDAHTLNDIGIAYTRFLLGGLSFRDIAEAIKIKERLKLGRD